MSRSQDDYAPTPQTQDQVSNSHDAEPADPEHADHDARRDLRLAPDSVKTDSLPDPFITENGRAETVAEAGETYLKIQRSNWDTEGRTSKYECHLRGLYRQILEADRHFQMRYDDLTTVILTRRLSPLDGAGDWLTPWECNEMLHGGSVHRSVRRALNYHLGDFEFEWVAVTAPTTSAGTPHEHIYLWVDDPENSVTTDHIKPALEKHLKYCINAHEKHHQYRADGTGGAITVQHDPDLRKQSHRKVAKQVMRGNTPPYPNTQGAQYLASQLVHLHVGDYYDSHQDDPPQALFEGAALAWASPYNWFRSSEGVPS